MNVLKTSSYANYRIDDIDYEERADGSLVYIFEVKQGNREFDVTNRCQPSQDYICNTPKIK